MNFQEEMRQTKAQLDQLSSSFCIAKWNQVTLHLESGYNHSCHHPKPHLTPRWELKKNHAALHNTKKKQIARKQMLQGKRPAECEYCWKVEDLQQEELFSDRILKSSNQWAMPFLAEIQQNPLNLEFLPKYLEVSFSNSCNLKCSYCSANYSTSWKNELKEGNYSTLTGKSTTKILEENENPYIQAFWKWWPQLNKKLQVLRITGGEPLLSKNTFRILEELILNPNPDLDLAINSNLAVSKETLKKLVDKINFLQEKKCVRKIEIYTSMEAVGAKAEYIRFGLNYARFLENVTTLLDRCPSIKITIMSTFNALSATSYIGLLKDVMKLNTLLSNEFRKKPVRLDISFLKDPKYQSVQLLTEEFNVYFLEIREFLQKHSRRNSGKIYGFEDDELLKFERVYSIYRSAKTSPFSKDLKRLFYIFFSEHDKRRGTNFLRTFPEYKNLWMQCELAMPAGKDSFLIRKVVFEYYRVKRRLHEFLSN
jgi:organic radical activating enzyme